MSVVVTGQFVSGDSIIHRLDPRSKMVGCAVIVVAAVLPGQSISVLLFDLGFVIFVIRLSQLGVIKVLSGLKSLRVLFLLTFVCQAIFTPGTPIACLGNVEISQAGLELALTTFLRLTLFYLATSLLTMTTSNLYLSAGIESLLAPLVHINFPVHRFAMIMNLSLRFIPTTMEEAQIISEAQRSRGARFDAGPLTDRIKAAVGVLIPLFGASLQRANDLALAMESRCYSSDCSNNRCIADLRFNWQDVIAIVVLLVFFLLPNVYAWTQDTGGRFWCIIFNKPGLGSMFKKA